MAYFAVSYQLNNQKDYEPLWKEMEGLQAHKAMRDYYLLDVDLELASDLSKHLRQFVDNDDMIFVARMDKPPSPHRCYEGTSAWITTRF